MGTQLIFETSGLPQLQTLVAEIKARGDDTQPLMLAIAQTGMQYSKGFIEAQHAPDGTPWTPSKAAKAEGRKTLIKTRHFLGTTFSAEATQNTAAWGSNFVAARWFQFGGTITRQPREGVARLRLNPDGSLMRQGSEGRLKRLARFASRQHKRVKEVAYKTGPYTISMGAWPFLGVNAEMKQTWTGLAYDWLIAGDVRGTA